MQSAYMENIKKRVLKIALEFEKKMKAHFSESDLENIEDSYYYHQVVSELKSIGAKKVMLIMKLVVLINHFQYKV